MGVIGSFCKLVGLLVTLLALFLGFMTTEHSLPVKKFVDEFDGSRGQFFKGMIPAFHAHTPWGFTHEELAKIKLPGQTIVVTGANTGLGYWTAYHVAGTGNKF